MDDGKESYPSRVSAATEITGIFERAKPAAYVVSAIWPDGGGVSQVEGNRQQLQLLLFEATCSAMMKDGVLDNDGRKALGRRFVEMMGWNPESINYDTSGAQVVDLEKLSESKLTEPDIDWPREL